MEDDVGRVLLALSLHDGPAMDELAERTPGPTGAASAVRGITFAQIAALVCLDAETSTFQVYVERALAAGAEPADLLDLLGGLAPLVGAARVAAGAASLARALGYDLDGALERHEHDWPDEPEPGRNGTGRHPVRGMSAAPRLRSVIDHGSSPPDDHGSSPPDEEPTMADTEPHGPVDFLLLEFPHDRSMAAVADELVALVESGTVRLYDLLVVRKDGDGGITVVDLQDVTAEGPDSFTVFAGARSGLLGDDDLDTAGEAMEHGTTAVLLVYENAWAVPFVAAAMDAGGQAVASMRIPATDIIEALDELESTQPVA